MAGLYAAPAWGLLPLAVPMFAVVVLRLGATAFDGEPLRRRLLGGAVLAAALAVLSVRVLGGASLLTKPALLATLVAVTAAVLLYRRDARIALAPPGQILSAENLPFAAVAAFTLLAATVAAYLLPIWQWDSIGYHLPYVSFALQEGSLAGVPTDIPYVSSYPHAVELLFVAWRAMLPDDRLVDAAQLPLGVLGALATACIARELGARRDHAVAAGCAWLTLPAVFLQLPTNYVDVAAAAFLLCAVYFVLAPMTARNVLAAGVALGLFLGSKPNAPMGTALLSGVLAVRGWRAGRRTSLAGAAAVALVLGAESYVMNVVRTGNPIWPVEVHLGPLHLAGLHPMSYLLDSGAGAPRIAGWGPLRVARSWITLDAPPAFDMRFGGLGLAFLVSVPVAAYALVRRRSVALVAAVAASLASPDPAVPRYVLAAPALAFALAAPALGGLGNRVRAAVLWTAAAATALSLVHAHRGLSGEGPPLAAYFAMTPVERARAVGADGRPDKFFEAYAHLGPGERTAFDDSLDLPYLAWPPDLSRNALWIGESADAAFIERTIADLSIRLLVVGDLTRAAFLAQPHFSALFHCKSAPCTVYVRR